MLGLVGTIVSLWRDNTPIGSMRSATTQPTIRVGSAFFNRRSFSLAVYQTASVLGRRFSFSEVSENRNTKKGHFSRAMTNGDFPLDNAPSFQ